MSLRYKHNRHTLSGNIKILYTPHDEIIVSKKIKIEEPYSKSVIIIWRERNNTAYTINLGIMTRF